MKIGTKNHINFMQEVVVGDKIIVENYEGEVVEIIEPNTIKVKYSKTKGNERVECWDKDFIFFITEKKEKTQ